MLSKVEHETSFIILRPGLKSYYYFFLDKLSGILKHIYPINKKSL